MQQVRGSLSWLPWWVVRGSGILQAFPQTTTSVTKFLHHTHRSLQAVTSKSLRKQGIDPIGNNVSIRSCTLCGGSIATRRSKTQLRHYSVYSGSDLEESSKFVLNFDKEKFNQLKVTLYPSSSDPILTEINEANSFQEVFNIIEKCGEQLNAEHASQAVVTLWDLQKRYCQSEVWDSLTLSGSLYNFSGSMRQHFLEKLMLHPVFELLVTKIECIYKDLNNVALTCVLLTLSKIGVKNDSPLIQKLLFECLERLEQFNLVSLSRLSVYLREFGLQGYFILSKLLPLLEEKLDDCSTFDDMNLLTISLNSCKRILTESLINRYISLVEQKVAENFFENCDPKVMLKIARFITYYDWSSKKMNLLHYLMLQVAEQIDELSVSQVFDLGNIFNKFLEPRRVLHKIQQYSLNFMEEAKVSEGTPAVLCLAPFTSTKFKNYYEELMAQHIDKADFYDYILVYFKALRFIKTSNFKLCNAFWMKSLNAVEMEIEKQSEQSLGMKDMLRRKIYHRYMFFNNNIGGTYRNKLFERKMSEMLLEDINSSTGLVPSKVANMSAFLLGYCPPEGLPKDLVERLLRYGPQFSIFDIMIMSRGIQISLVLKRSTGIKRTLMQQVTDLSRMMDTMTEEHMKNPMSVEDVAHIARGYMCRHKSPSTQLLEKIVAAFIPVIDQFDSRHIRNISSFLIWNNYISFELLDSIIEYICKHSDSISIITAEMVLFCLFHLGYSPPQNLLQKFYDVCTTIFLEDGHMLNGLHTLRVCLALNMFGSLSPNIIHEIFTISFMDQLDQEISQFYSKTTYAQNVRHLMMDLNRAVCLDCPEEHIPWFHEKYCQDLLETVPVPKSAFHTEVYQALVQLVGGPEVLRANVHSPYYYFLDFEFLLDGNSRPVSVNEYTAEPSNSNTRNQHETKPGYRRIALLVRKESHYPVNAQQLLGQYQVERRHLEVLGYEVIEVPHFHWYSMALPTFEDKLGYLRGLIFPSQNVQSEYRK